MKLEEYQNKIQYQSNIRPIARGFVWHMAYHFDTQRPAAVSRWVDTVNTLCKHEPGLVPKFRINRNPYMINKTFTTTNPWVWKWDVHEGKFLRNVEELDLDLDKKFFLRLVTEKGAALDRINFHIDRVRHNFKTDIERQDWLESVKTLQAQTVLADADPELEDSRWPMIADIARIENLDIKMAANLVMLDSRARVESLQQTEAIRYKYTQYVLNSSEIYEITAILNDFTRENFTYY